MPGEGSTIDVTLLVTAPGPLFSRFPAMVRIEYPLIPPQPSGFEVNAGNFQVPSIHFDLPPDTRDIFGILIQDKRTVINSQVTLVSDTAGDFRGMLVVGQDPLGNYMEETIVLNGTTPVTTVKTFYWILWVDSYYGTVLNEIPTPPTNGTATVFTVRDNPVPGTVQVYVDAVAQVLGVDYTTTGNQVTFVNPPVTGSEIFISYIYELMPNATVTITPPGGVLAPGALQWLANPILYRYEDLSFGGSNNDPALTFNFQNTLQETSHDFWVYFYNLLDELSLPYNPLAHFLQPNQAGIGVAGECPLDVRNFGAIGDGVADDTAAVQAALNQAAANYKALVAAGLQFSDNETLSGSPPFGGGQPPIGPTGSPGAFGSTIVCIPSGVYCKVYARTPDNSQPCGFFNNDTTSTMTFIFNSPGFTALTIDDGVTILCDGALILGFNEDYVRYLNSVVFDSFGAEHVPVWIIQNVNAFNGGPQPSVSQDTGFIEATSYLGALANFEGGPRNNGIRLTGQGFFDCGLTYASLEMQLAAEVLQVSGVCFMKCDQSQIDGLTFQHFGHGVGVYWGHSEKVSVFNNLFQNGIHAQSCNDLCSAPFVDTSSNVGLVVDVLRGSMIHNNVAIDVDTWIIETANFHTDIVNNRAQQCGTPCQGTHLFLDQSYFFCWFFNEPFRTDGNRKENHYANNRGIVWKPNQLVEWDHQAVPTQYQIGDHMWLAWPCSPANTPTTVGFGTSHGITGPTEPDWTHSIGSFFGFPAAVAEPQTRVTNAFIFIAPPGGVGAGFGSILPFTGLSTTGADLVVYKNGVPITRGVDWSWNRAGDDGITYLKALAGDDIVTYDVNVQMAWMDSGIPQCTGAAEPGDGPNQGSTMTFMGAAGGTNNLLAVGIRCIANHISDNYMSGISFEGLNRPQFSDNMVQRNYGYGIIDLSNTVACDGLSTSAVVSDNVASVNNDVSDNVCGQILINSPTVLISNPLVAAGGGGGGNEAISEIPAGVINGSNTHFTLAHTPLAGSLIVFRDGLRTTAFTQTGTTLTMTTAPTSSLIVDYQY